MGLMMLFRHKCLFEMLYGLLSGYQVAARYQAVPVSYECWVMPFYPCATVSRASNGTRHLWLGITLLLSLVFSGVGR